MTLRSPLGRLLALAVVPALGVVVLALWLSEEAGKTPVQVIPALGVLLWMAAAAIALFTALSGLVWQPRCRGLLLLGGLLSLLQSLDDLFLLHERSIAPAFLHLLYAGVAIFILVRYWDLLVDSGSALSFLSAVFFLSSSILFDGAPRLFPFSYEQVQMLEQGSQFIGIACWLLFWWQVSAFAAKLRPVH
ncbi:MAG TPA: oxidoreductase [Cyanobium sp.]|nr:oxidoreductase [Cyanobium sp.]